MIAIRTLAVAALALAAAAAPALARDWVLDPAASSLGFTFQQGGSPVEGQFERFEAEIRFDPQALDQARVVARIDLASVSTGAPDRDGTLQTAEWFDAGSQPQAVFEATRFRAEGSGYVAEGTLSLKGQAVPVQLPFTLQITGDRAVVSGTATLDRMALGIGASAGVEMVAPEVQVQVDLQATAKP